MSSKRSSRQGTGWNLPPAPNRPPVSRAAKRIAPVRWSRKISRMVPTLWPRPSITCMPMMAWLLMSVSSLIIRLSLVWATQAERGLGR